LSDPERLCPFDPDCDDDELCAVEGVAVVDVAETPVAEEPATAACVLCADAAGAAEFCACASN
jgi:hypothetical protein